jgi:WD40 repeat protein
VSNTLLETGIYVREKQETQFLRVTARVGDLQIEIPKSSFIDRKPWAKVAQLYGHRDRATAITFLDDYRTLISADNLGNLCWWDMSGGGDLMAVNPMNSKIWSLATDREGDLVAVGLHDGTIAVLDTKQRRERWRAKLHKGPICGLAFSPDCQFLYAGSFDKTYSSISAHTGKPFYRTKPQRTVLRSLVLSGNGHVVATTNQGRGDVSLFEAKTGGLIAELKGHSNDITCVAFSLDDYLLASGSKDDTVRLWDASTQKELRKFDGFSRGVLSIAISPDGRLLATTSGEPKVRIWRLKTQERLADVESGNESIQSICFSPDQQLLAGASDDGSIYVWRVEEEAQ